MISPWKNPLPLQEHSKNQVVVFFYSDGWIPMTCFRLNEAIELHHKAMMRGKKIFVFPSGLDLETKNILAQESSALPLVMRKASLETPEMNGFICI